MADWSRRRPPLPPLLNQWTLIHFKLTVITCDINVALVSVKYCKNNIAGAGQRCKMERPLILSDIFFRLRLYWICSSFHSRSERHLSHNSVAIPSLWIMNIFPPSCRLIRPITLKSIYLNKSKLFRRYFKLTLLHIHILDQEEMYIYFLIILS